MTPSNDPIKSEIETQIGTLPSDDEVIALIENALADSSR